MTRDIDAATGCPIPISDYPEIALAHGGGGTLTRQLIEQIFLPAFANPMLEARHDGAVFKVGDAKLAFTTDSYVVRPCFFPGGDIGMLAVNGTVNDLAMCGARPLYLSAGLILEEGIPMSDLKRVVASMKNSAARAGVKIVTGDTKVVDKGSGDGIFVNTAGLGIVETQRDISPGQVRPGDSVILSGDIGRHGMAIMSIREGLEFDGPIESDTAALHDAVLAMIEADLQIHCLRDATRGGLATVLIEIATAASLDIVIDETAILVDEAVRGACEILGLDPLYVANEGRFLSFVPASEQDAALKTMRAHTSCSNAHVIGSVTDRESGNVVCKTAIGGQRVLDMLTGDQLPRIC